MEGIKEEIAFTELLQKKIDARKRARKIADAELNGLEILLSNLIKEIAKHSK